jgi:hypothetical protein
MKSKFYEHRQNARRRNIEFNLTYDEWMNIWVQSGHWNERGRGLGKYAMCRYGDQGPYEVGNVYIDLCEVNAQQARLGDKNTKAHIAKIRKALTGKKKTMTAIKNNSFAQLNRTKYNCPHCNKLISGMGNVKQHIVNKHRIAA